LVECIGVFRDRLGWNGEFVAMKVRQAPVLSTCPELRVFPIRESRLGRRRRDPAGTSAPVSEADVSGPTALVRLLTLSGRKRRRAFSQFMTQVGRPKALWPAHMSRPVRAARQITVESQKATVSFGQERRGL
jgi:hypothetical protein